MGSRIPSWPDWLTIEITGTIVAIAIIVLVVILFTPGASEHDGRVFPP